MTVIRPNSVSGINSITAQSDEIKVFKSDGTQGGLIIGGANLNATSGISTLLALNVTGNVSIAGTLTYQDVTNVDSVGIITARSTIDAQGVINLADSIIHTGDTNTKIRFPTADTFTVETAGNERFRIGSNGKIGIGTDNPTSILDARGNVQFGDGGGFDMNVLGTRHQFSINGSEKLRIASNGNIFVNNGNASANATLILSKSASGFAKLEFDEVTSQKAYIELDASEDLVHYGAAGVNQTFYAGGSERLRITSDGYVHLGNTGHGTNKVGGQAVTGEDFDPYFKMYASTSNHWLMQLRSDTGTGSNGIFMRAGTNSNDYTAYLTGRDEHVKHFIVRGDGNIGIGTDNPQKQLQILGNSDTCIRVTSAAGGAASLQLGDTSDTVKGAITFLNSDNSLRIRGHNNDDRIIINSSGTIQCGTSSVLQAFINNSVSGHQFISQCDDNQNGFEIYQKHGATHTRASFAVYDNKTGSKDLSFKIDGAGWTYNNTTYNGTTNGVVDKRYNWGSANNLNFGMQCTTRHRFSIWEHRQIGRSSPRTAQMSCGENASNQGLVYIYSSTANADVTGGVVLNNGATSWSGVSDMRLKNKTGDILNALEDINKIEPLKFTWKYGPDNNPHVGVSAQSVENVVPEAIDRGVDVERQREGDETEYMRVRYTELIPLSIAAIKELKAEVESLKAEIASLKSS